MPAPRPPESDDPTGGRALTRRLARLLPAAALVGLAIGIPLAVVTGEWRVAALVTGALVALTGTIAAAVEDGRVQRRIDRRRGGGGAGRP